MKEFIINNCKTVFTDKFNILLILIFFVGKVLCLGYFFNWFMLILASYTIISNNYIQTIGSFMIANKDKIISNWIFFSFIFIITSLISWLIYNGELHYGLLNTIEYKENLSLIIIFIPLLLNIFTKYGIPVSVTFLIIPLFTTKSTVESMMMNTILSYFLAFIISFLIWNLIYSFFKNSIRNENNDNTEIIETIGIDSNNFENKNKIINIKDEKEENTVWNIMEYLSTGLLWMAWNIINICNFVVFVDRKFNVYEFFIFNIIIVIIIYIILSKGGGNIEKIISEKKDSNNKKSMTVFNILFAFILLDLQFFSKIPLTTTWVFLGLLAGRELSITYVEANFLSGNSFKISLKKIIKDLNRAIIGIVYSLTFVKLILLFG